jgi:hypothetical protein
VRLHHGSTLTMTLAEPLRQGAAAAPEKSLIAPTRPTRIAAMAAPATCAPVTAPPA